MTHATLFSGIGAAELAAEDLGWTNLFNCDNNEFTQKVLKYHFPNAKQYSMCVQTANFSIWRDKVDVLTGGFPCQPFSISGKRKGTEDNRYLWNEFLRVIREIRPRWVVGENALGILSWSKGLVFETVCADLEGEGYQVTPYILPAAGVGAPHQRYRVFFVAHNQSFGRNARCTDSYRETDNETKRTDISKFPSRPCQVGTTADTDSDRCRKWQSKQEFITELERTSNNSTCRDKGIFADTDSNRPQERCGIGKSKQRASFVGFDRFPTQSPVCSRDDGFSAGLDASAILNGKRLTFPKWREESIKAYGNAIVPQVLMQIYKAIENYEKKQRQ